jgi:two-component system, chemotaxis family, protein-glutamate methylesterase/glutaminase
MNLRPRYQAVVIGASAGGSTALAQVLPRLPADFSLPVVIVQHLHPHQESAAMLYQSNSSSLYLKEADEKEPLRPGCIYFAPPNYHLLIEANFTFSLSIDAKVNFTRPSIDVLFESAAAVYRHGLVGIILSGANNDGAAGLRAVKEHGGLTIVQSPESAREPTMPKAALAATQVDYILPAEQISAILIQAAEELEEDRRSKYEIP